MCHQENKYDLICSHPTCKTCQMSESEMQTKQLNGRQAPKLTEWPDVRLGAEFAVSDDLWGWPLDRELGALWARVLIIKNKSRVWRVDTDHKLWLTVTLMLCNNLKKLIFTNIPGHSKVRYLHLVVLWDETVPGSLWKEERKDKVL